MGTKKEVSNIINIDLDTVVRDSNPLSFSSFAPISITEKKTFVQKLKQKKNTPYLIAGSIAAIGGGIYYLMHKAWWTDKSRSFHFDTAKNNKLIRYKLNEE